MNLTMIGIGMPGVPEILIILFVMLLLFGSSKLPKLARSLGSSVTEFRKGLKGEGGDDKQNLSGGDDGNGDGEKEDPAEEPSSSTKES